MVNQPHAPGFFNLEKRKSLLLHISSFLCSTYVSILGVCGIIGAIEKGHSFHVKITEKDVYKEMFRTIWLVVRSMRAKSASP